MSNRGELISQLEAARHELHKAQALVAELEFQLTESPPESAAQAVISHDASSLSSNKLTDQPLNLLETEQQLRLFIEYAPAAIAMLDTDMKYLLVSYRWLSDYRLDERDVVGRSHYEVFPDIPEQWKVIHQRCLQGAIEKSEADPFPRADGTLDWVRWEIRPWHKSNGDIGGILLFSEVITQRMQGQIALERYANRLETLHSIDHTLITGGSVQSLVDTTLRHIRDLIPCQRVNVIIIDPSTNVTTLFALEVEGYTLVTKDIPIPVLPDIVEGLDKKHIKVVEDLRLLPETLQRQLIDEGLTTALQAMLMFEGQPLGWLGLFSDKPEFFTEEYQAIAAEIASQLAIAIHHMRLTEELTRHQQILEQLVESRTSELVTAKEQVEAILNNSPDAILLVTTDMRIQQTNAAFNKMFRCQPDDYFEQSSLKLICPEYRDMVIRMAEAVISEQTGLYFEVKALRKDGTDFEAEFSAGLIRGNGLVWSIRDITERKATERQLRYQASLQDNVSDAVIVTDMAFHIQSWNKAAERIYGWTMEESIGKVAPEFLKIRFLSNQDEEMSLRRFNEHGSLQQETIQSRKDGRDISILGSAARLEDNHGIAVGMIAINRDITERKATERQLRYQASLQDNVSDAVIVTDMEFRIQSWNKAAERIYGWRTDEVIDNNTAKILPTEYATSDEQERSILHLHEHGWWEGEVTQCHKDGHSLFILGSMTLVKDENGIPFSIVAINRDITERKRTEEILRHSEERFASVFRFSPVAIGLTTAAEGRYLDVNDSLLQLLGYSRDEMIGRTASELNVWFTPEEREGAVQTILEQGSVRGLEVRFRQKSGGICTTLTSIVPVMLNGQSCLLSIVQDITERKRTEQALYESEKRYRLLAENVTDVITVVDAQGIRTFVTPSCYALIGYTPDELVGQPNVNIVHPDDLHTSQAIILSAIESGKMTFMYERRIRHKAGHYVWVEGTGSIIRDATSGDLVEVITVIRDITERKRTQAALNTKFREELEFQNYLKTLHDITIELTDIDVLDTFYKRVVELGLERLGFDRLALFLYDEKDGSAMGTYGTDPDGNLSYERLLRFIPDADGIMLRAFERSERFCFYDNTPLYHNEEVIGIGWHAATVLWNGTRSLGWLIADNLLTQSPASKPLLDILGLYAQTIASLLIQKRVQIALHESEMKYRLLAENITDVIVKMSLDGIRTFITPSCYSLLGYTPEELIGKPGFEIVHPDDRLIGQSVLLEAINSAKSSFTLTQRVLHKKGHHIWVEVTTTIVRDTVTGVVQELMGVIRDVTERELVSAELERQRIFLRNVIDVSPSLIFVKDYNGRFVLANQMLAQLHNMPVTALIGKTDAEINPLLDEVDHFVENDRQVIETGKPIFLEEFATGADGTKHWFQTTKVQIISPDGQSKYLLGVATNITEQKQAENTLRQALQKERELGELKTRFVSMASHEFRTPLATILALTETLSAYRHKLSSEQIDQRLDKIQIQVAHLKDIMEDVLLLARMQARRVEFNPTDVDLDGLCRSVLDEFESDINTQHRLVYVCEPNIPNLKLDRKLMRQIISNLVGNALKYSPEHKPVYVILKYADDALMLHVKDEGIGIPKTDLLHLFEPFHRADNVGTTAGTGLGLVITKEAVELHGGNITVESQLNIGTTFTVRIPLMTKENNNHD